MLPVSLRVSLKVLKEGSVLEVYARMRVCRGEKMVESAMSLAMAEMSLLWWVGSAFGLRSLLRVARRRCVSGEERSMSWRMCLVTSISSSSNLRRRLLMRS